MTTFARAAELAREGVRNPDDIAPYLRERAGHAQARLATWRAARGLRDQREALDSLRAGDEWLLIVLDACRVDALRSVAPLVFDGRVEALASAGHDTFEYVRKCWPATYSKTTYVSGATPINSADVQFEADGFDALYQGYRPCDHLGSIVDVWRDGWDAGLGTVPGSAVTEAASKRLDTDRLVAHYFQPHAPYIGHERRLGHAGDEHADPIDGEPADAPIWRAVERGEVSDVRLRELYRSNLRGVLWHVAELVEQAPHDEVVVVGDHGEALGEYGVFGHPRRPHPGVRQVPWLRVNGVRDGWRDHLPGPQPTSGESVADGSVADRLAALGYIGETTRSLQDD